MSQLNGREKALVVRMFDAALSRLLSGEEVTFTVALAPVGQQENSVGFLFTRGAAKAGRHLMVTDLAKTLQKTLDTTLDETSDAVRRET